MTIKPLSRIYHKIRLAETFLRLISGLAEFLRKPQNSAKIRLNIRNSAENTAEYQKFCYQDRKINETRRAISVLFPFSKKWTVRKYKIISNELVNSDNNAK